jgi:hypothetical protein
MPNRLKIPLFSTGRSSLEADLNEADLVAIAKRDRAAFASLYRLEAAWHIGCGGDA